MSLIVITQTVDEVTVAAATLATEPPVVGSMLDLSKRTGRQSVARALVQLRGTAAATLTNGKIWGRDASGRLKFLGWVRDGIAVAVNATLGTDQIVDQVPVYTHLGVTGTLTAGSLVMGLVELEEDD